jgi:hypothetical protein
VGRQSFRLWPGVAAQGTVCDVFLLAYTDLRRVGRTGLGGCTAKSLRRVGADVVVVLNCSSANAKRLRRDARYDHVIAYTLEDAGRTHGARIEVAVLSDCELTLRKSSGATSMLCDLTVDGKTASVGTLEPTNDSPYTVSLRIDVRHPVVLVGDVGENLDDPAVIDGIIRAGFLDTHPARPTNEPDREVRTHGILAKGLRSYGDGIYHNTDGCQVHWARLGH